MVRRNMDLASFLANAPSLFGEEATQEEEVDPDISRGLHHGAIRCFGFPNGDTLSCVRWDSRFHITSTDIIRALVHRFEDILRPVVNVKKFEEGVFSDLRCLKPGVDARLELPRSEFLELLYKHHCVRTQKKQKVFYWASVPHDMLFRDALERDLKREAMGIEPTTKITKDADPSSLVVIGGVELPLSVPPTLAAHLHTSAPAAGSAAAGPVSTPLVTSASHPPASTAASTAPPSCAGDSDTHPLHPAEPAAASWPEDPAASTALLNGGWAGVDLHTLRRKTPGLHAEYDPYHSTPTPHHSPEEGAANTQDLLSLLSADPNALITQDNVGDFSAILDQLLSGSVQTQARTMEQDFALDSQALSQALFAPLDPVLSPAAARSTSAASMDIELDGSQQPVARPAAVSLATAVTPAGSMGSSPSIVSAVNAGHMSLSVTPELVGPQEFRGGQPMTIDDIDSLLATVGSSSSGPVGSIIDGATSGAAPRLSVPALDGLLPMLSAPTSLTGMADATPPLLPPARSADDSHRPAEDPRQPWRDQKPGIVPPPRSTRFSRFHPYLKTMARIAHRGSPTILNRMPSTADPNVAAAAVSALVAKSGATTAAAPVFGLSAAPAPVLLDTAALAAGDAATVSGPGVGEGAMCCTEDEPCSALSSGGDPAACQRGATAGEDEDQRRYSCTFTGCVKQFKRHEHLKRHFRTHTGERPYKCPVAGCSKIFARMDNLNQHSRTHVNRKTAPRRASHKLPDGAVQPPEPAPAANGVADVGAAAEFSASRPATMILDAPDVGLGQPAMAMPVASVAADVDAYAYGGGAAPGGIDLGPPRIAVPTDLAFLNREWILRNLGVQLAQQQPQQVQPLLPPQTLLTEHNIVSLLRKMSKGNRVRVVGGTPMTMGDAAAARTREEQAPYVAGVSFAAAEATAPGGPQLAPAPDAAGLGPAADFGPDATSINPIWLASFLSQQQQQVAAELVPAPSSRPMSLKRHHDEDDSGGDVAMSGNYSDGSTYSPAASDCSRQGSIPGNGSSSIGTAKLVRSRRLPIVLSPP